jgi:uncharacterized membrane protein
VTLSLAPAAMTRGSSRWLLLGSLALNLFFIGIAVAMAIRSPAPRSTWDPNVFVRIERVAESLPAADADLLRGEINKGQPALSAAQEAYHRARDEIRTALRQQPFNPAALREVMAQTRLARQNQDQIVQNLFAEAAAKMSRAGRLALADWPPHRKFQGQER